MLHISSFSHLHGVLQGQGGPRNLPTGTPTAQQTQVSISSPWKAVTPPATALPLPQRQEELRGWERAAELALMSSCSLDIEHRLLRADLIHLLIPTL